LVQPQALQLLQVPRLLLGLQLQVRQGLESL
jgi:hypothetical protein